MDLASLIPGWLDAIFIAPFRWPASPYLGMWLGSSFLSVYSIAIGELFSAFLFLVHHRYYLNLQDKMMHYHNLSVQALHSGNKEAYLAANKLAQEDFGKSFFAQATIGIASLWPVPFALGWMALRFEGIELYHIPGIEAQLGYVFVFLTLYITMRILFSRYLKDRLPLFSRIAAIKKEAKEARGKAKSFFNPPSENPDADGPESEQPPSSGSGNAGA